MLVAGSGSAAVLFFCCCFFHFKPELVNLEAVTIFVTRMSFYV